MPNPFKRLPDMPNLLIHSMSEFSDIIIDGLAVAGASRICEIGAEFGGMSQLLSDYAGLSGGELISIDPAPKSEFLSWAAEAPHVRHIAATSLDAIGTLADIDAWIVDGDHNWYTVYHELNGINALCQRDSKPFLAFMHDVAWPCARRDLYYAPHQIPAEYRHPYDYDGGIIPDNAGLLPGRGFRGMGQFAAALVEGGPRNGVKTAIEDFIDEQNAAGREMAYAEVPAVFGLGILFDLDAPWSVALANLLVPFHQNRLLATLERNRLDNYLAVLDWQDGNA
jgi:hypothetical protein